ncbi:regulator of MON1-CCZ1 complex-like [Sycon ciliatum]|uniref:regulator of MON1-CCZ1 complex-like n=1 Tax=Sycon ciliatum TaxID=27933 RepID=UPI0020AEEA87
MSGHYLDLSANPLRFQPIGKSVNVFFDEANRQVFAVNSGNSDIAVTSWDTRKVAYIRVPETGPVLSIKFSLDKKVLAIQRSSQHVDFVNLGKSGDAAAYSQQCKGKTTEVRSFHWTNINEIIFVTTQGVEFYQVFPEKRSLKLLRSFSVSVNWFVFSPLKNVLLLSTSSAGNTICPFHFRPQQVTRMPKFEIDLPPLPKPSKADKNAAPAQPADKLRLLDRDVTLALLYGQLYVVVVRNQARSSGIGAEIVLYLLTKDVPAKRVAVLKLDMNGRFAVNTVDNLLIVHHQASKTSAVFDIRWAGDYDGAISLHHPVLAALPISPVTIPAQETKGEAPAATAAAVAAPTAAAAAAASVVPAAEAAAKSVSCELYSPNWVVFQPNIIIDARLGCMWEVELKLEVLVSMMADKKQLIDFLLLRSDSKIVILDVCKQSLVPGRQSSLSVIARVFDTLNAVYKEHLKLATARSSTRTDDRRLSISPQVNDISFSCVIDQHDMYKHVLSQVVDIKSIQYKFMVAVIIEYIRSLNSFQIAVQHFLYEVVIKLLVENNQFYQLHQFLQYHVLSDSKPLACLMLSLESVYAPAFQLALDMLKRLSTVNDDIVDVLLSKNQLIPALRFLRSNGREDSVPARLFLEAAANSGDNALFFTVYKFFEERNMRLRRKPGFSPADHCDQYVALFNSLFGDADTPKQQVNIPHLLE